MIRTSDYDDEELNDLLNKRASEEQRRAEAEKRKQSEIESQRDAALRAILTPEARQRLSNIKLVKPDFANSLSDQLIVLAQSGRIKVPITDDDLKAILSQLTEQNRRDFKIQIRERGWNEHA